MAELCTLLYLRRRRRLKQVQITILGIIGFQKLTPERTMWVKKRSQSFWYNTMLQN